MRNLLLLLPYASITFFLFAFLFARVDVVFAQEEEGEIATCYANEEDPYVLFSTKTSYLEVDNEDVEPIILPGCQPKSFWLVARHGARNPGGKGIKRIKEHVPQLRDKIVENHEAGKGRICNVWTSTK